MGVNIAPHRPLITSEESRLALDALPMSILECCKIFIWIREYEVDQIVPRARLQVGKIGRVVFANIFSTALRASTEDIPKSQIKGT